MAWRPAPSRTCWSSSRAGGACLQKRTQVSPGWHATAAGLAFASAAAAAYCAAVAVPCALRVVRTVPLFIPYCSAEQYAALARNRREAICVNAAVGHDFQAADDIAIEQIPGVPLRYLLQR